MDGFFDIFTRRQSNTHRSSSPVRSVGFSLTPPSECEICHELAAANEFTTLPCTYGHQFMTTCIIKWLQAQSRLHVPDASCPKCRETVRYGLCDHLLEADRLKQGRDIKRSELLESKCSDCLDEEHYEQESLDRQQREAEYDSEGDSVSPVATSEREP
ncbi:hypothetical protein BJ170DRAFT_358026 [Xylariales sp. AK1849]|nr:hypothetical protein BJ170DRAFT_358026 [Xylariales sp. AK1849]